MGASSRLWTMMTLEEESNESARVRQGKESNQLYWERDEPSLWQRQDSRN